MVRRRRRRTRNLPSDPVELTIDRISHEGRGVASNDGKVTFVEGGLPGERVMARYLHCRSSFDETTTIDVLDPSPDRVTPPCPYFTVCGGCSLQHLASLSQIEFKQELLLDQLHHATGLDADSFEVLDIERGPTLHYRRKARLAVRYVEKKGGALVGFREKHSTFVTQMDSCHVLTTGISRLLTPLKELVNKLDARRDVPQFEVAAGNNDAGKSTVALILRHLKPLSADDLDTLSVFAADYGCELYLQPKGPDSIHKLWPSEGEDRLHYLVIDPSFPDLPLTVKFHPADFVQINEEINSKAIRLAIGLLDLEPADRVLDLFCGLGNFSLPLARHCRQLTGIEGSEEMVTRARENAATNNISNAGFEMANLYELSGSETWLGEKYSKVLLDPPRSGALELIDWLVQCGARKIVYISCNPATLARDASLLVNGGYALRRAGVMDMFPHTAHVESIAEFELVK